ncbi:hypothetical protein [Acrocarpospora sp. B8E8]|uniref:hypothetical protein n=1 Tax=Acrocarpospora sp. B8E8 TaxID=3153572 RepID=UPI00325D8A9C
MYDVAQSFQVANSADGAVFFTGLTARPFTQACVSADAWLSSESAWTMVKPVSWDIFSSLNLFGSRPGSAIFRIVFRMYSSTPISPRDHAFEIWPSSPKSGFWAASCLCSSLSGRSTARYGPGVSPGTGGSGWADGAAGVGVDVGRARAFGAVADCRTATSTPTTANATTRIRRRV